MLLLESFLPVGRIRLLNRQPWEPLTLLYLSTRGLITGQLHFNR